MARCHAHAAHVHLHLHLWTLCTLSALLAMISPFTLPIRKFHPCTHPPTQGVTHRDLKLENVLLTADDRCKLCDFGLAHAYPRGPHGEVPTQRAPLTVLCGSKSYAAPEVLASLGSNPEPEPEPDPNPDANPNPSPNPNPDPDH